MRYISELIDKKRKLSASDGGVVLEYCGNREICPPPFSVVEKKAKVNILALGDVGGTVLLGLKLLGGDIIETIGIYDLDEDRMRRYEREINQICFPDGRIMPRVEIRKEDSLFDCDMFVFCASKGVPPVGVQGDVRMAQFKANSELVSIYAGKAVRHRFNGIFAVVSDPVDPLCKAALCKGLKAEQIQGYGLGVMNGRASYFAQKDSRFSMYIKEGRAFGPHGEDLVIANSIENYDSGLSDELTRLTVNSNMEIRADGFKPYIAPAISSGAVSIAETLRGGWNYSSVYLGYESEGAFFGCRNRRTEAGIELENLSICNELFDRIKNSYENLCKMEIG